MKTSENGYVVVNHHKQIHEARLYSYQEWMDDQLWSGSHPLEISWIDCDNSHEEVHWMVYNVIKQASKKHMKGWVVVTWWNEYHFNFEYRK